MKKEGETLVLEKDIKAIYNEVKNLKIAFNKLVDVLEELEEKMNSSLQHVSQTLMAISKLISIEKTTNKIKPTNYHI